MLDSNVPILVKQTPQEVTLDIEAKADIDMFHHLFFTLAPDDKYIRYTIDKAMYLVDETGLAATLHHPVATADYRRTTEACPQNGE